MAIAKQVVYISIRLNVREIDLFICEPLINSIMVPAKDVINAIKNLDLTKYPHDEILSELRKIGKAGLVMNTLHPNYEVIRVRPNRNGERFSNINDLTYKPEEFNKTYQRGSTPNKTMFYGSSTQKNTPGPNLA